MHFLANTTPRYVFCFNYYAVFAFFLHFLGYI